MRMERAEKDVSPIYLIGQTKFIRNQFTDDEDLYLKR